jgi:hypothetical protein
MFHAMILFTGRRSLHYMLQTRLLARGAENSTLSLEAMVNGGKVGFGPIKKYHAYEIDRHHNSQAAAREEG